MTFEFFAACVVALMTSFVLLPYLPVAERTLVVVIADQTVAAVAVVPRRLLRRQSPDSPDH